MKKINELINRYSVFIFILLSILSLLLFPKSLLLYAMPFWVLAPVSFFLGKVSISISLVSLFRSFSRHRRTGEVENGMYLSIKKSDAPRVIHIGKRRTAGMIFGLFSSNGDKLSEYRGDNELDGSVIYSIQGLGEGPFYSILNYKVNNQLVDFTQEGKAISFPYNERDALSIFTYLGYQNQQSSHILKESQLFTISKYLDVYNGTNVGARITRDYLYSRSGFNENTVYPMDKVVVIAGCGLPKPTENGYLITNYSSWSVDKERDPGAVAPSQNLEIQNQWGIRGRRDTIISPGFGEEGRDFVGTSKRLIDKNGIAVLTSSLWDENGGLEIKPPAIFLHIIWKILYYYNSTTNRYEKLGYLVENPSNPDDINSYHPKLFQNYEFEFESNGTSDEVRVNGYISEKITSTGDFRLLGIAYSIVRFQFYKNIYTKGLPEITYECEGPRNMWDPRKHREDLFQDGYYNNDLYGATPTNRYFFRDVEGRKYYVNSDVVTMTDTEIPYLLIDDIPQEFWNNNPDIIIEGGLRVFPDVEKVITNTTFQNYSNNSALALVYYMSHRMGMNLTLDKFDEENIKWAADVCDELVTLKNGLKEKRYTCDVRLRTDDSHATNIDIILETMAGRLSYREGVYYIYPGTYRQPVFNITKNILVSDVKMQSNVPNTVKGNSIKGVFYSEYHDNNPIGYIPQVNQTEIDAIEQESSIILDLEGVVRHTHAQRLARIKLNEMYHSGTLNITCNVLAESLQTDDIVSVTLNRQEIFDKKYIINGITRNESEEGIITIQLQLREYDESIYYFDPNWYGELNNNLELKNDIDIPKNEQPNIILEDDKISINTLDEDGGIVDTLSLSDDTTTTQYNKNADNKINKRENIEKIQNSRVYIDYKEGDN